MSGTADDKRQNRRFLETLADELNDTPASELLDGGSEACALKVGARLLQSAREEADRRRPAALEKGAVVRGTVKNLTDYGAYVDLGGIDGLLETPHIRHMVWKPVGHPSEVLKVGDEIDVRILAVDLERPRIWLAPTGADPKGISRRYPPHTRVFGKVTRVGGYGAFVEIEEDVEGIVHVSQMDWTNRNVNPANVVRIGQQVEVMVLDVDEEHRKISLGLKQCRAKPALLRHQG